MKPALALLLALLPLAAAERPNVLLIISDDQAWTDYGFMGHPAIDTPNLDELASQSLTYTRGYVSSPLCRPSLASIFTGLPTHLHGVTGNDPKPPELAERENDWMSGRADPVGMATHETVYQNFGQNPGLAELLKDAGYLTLQTGKWWESNPIRFGFTDAMTHGDPERGARHGDEGLAIAREGLEPIRLFLKAADAADAPFFIWHAPFLPHTPHNPPEELFEKYSTLTDSPHVARYWAMCEWFDETCGNLLRLLEAFDHADDTLVLYVCDNGWIQRPNSGRYAPRSKQEPYEGGIRTPIMVRWPGHVEALLDRRTPVSSTDLAPTILEAVGLPVPDGMPGIDLRDRDALAERDTIFGSDHHHDIHDVHHPNRNLQTRYIVSGWWKLIDPVEGEPELYHLKHDPYEENDLAPARPERVTELKNRLDAWWPGPI